MAETARKNNKNLILGICSAVVAVVVIVVVIILATTGGARVNDSFFKSDDTKYVISVDTSDSDEAYPPVKTHMVYYYSGEDITDVKIYYEFKDAAEAKDAYDAGKEDATFSDYKKLEIDGKYVVLTAKESEYKDLKASDVKAQIEFMELINNMEVVENEEAED